MPRSSLSIVLLLVFLVAAGGVWGASLTEQRRELSRASTAIRVAERMARSKRNDEAIAAFAEAQEALQAASEGLDERLQRSFDRTKEKLDELHSALTQAGLTVPALTDISATEAEPTPRMRDDVEPRDGSISFVDQVVPILTSKCGGCHVRGTRGDVSFASYNNIVEGAPSGRYVEVGSGMESLLVDVIASGQMPPNGNVVPPAEAQMLLMWINQGARFDGDDPEKPLGQLVRTGESMRASDDADIEKSPSQPIPKPTGSETVSFALDIAPMLVESCNECHGTAGPRAGFSVASFDRLWAGGNAGPAIVPGDPEGSLLVQKLRGTATDGARMPQNRPAWSDDQIALVAKWIAEGASFDAPDATQPLARVAALTKAARATPEQLSAEREQLAQRQWRLAIPDESAGTAASEHFLAVGSVPESALERLVATAEAEAVSMLQFFKTADQPFNKAHVTLYAFDSRIDYSEFGTMVERRSLPPNVMGHARFDIVHPYVALVVGDEPNGVANHQLASYLAALWVADQAEDRLPDWFTMGSGMAVAARLHSKDDEVRRWRDQVPAAVASLTEPDAFMTGKLPPQTAELLAFGFVDALMQKPANFSRLVKAASSTSDFDAACQQVFKRSSKDLAALWVASERGSR